jgi:hypothetical protein
MNCNHFGEAREPRFFSRRLAGLLALFCLTSVSLSVPVLAEDTKCQKESLPDTRALLAALIEHERTIDQEFQSLVFRDDVTVSALDPNGQPHAAHSETRYFSAPGYSPFALHITTNEKSMSIPFSEILGRSRLIPRESSELDGTTIVVFSFEPQSPVAKHGDLENRIAGDLKGTIWVSPKDASIVRFEFRSVLPISLGWGYLGRMDFLEGSIEMRKIGDNLWLPVRQEFVAQGKNVVAVVGGLRFSKSFRTLQKDELSHYSPAYHMVQTNPSPFHYGD